MILYVGGNLCSCKRPKKKTNPFSFLCRNPGEDTKMLVCDMCDKGYHTFCLQPAIDSLPTNGWRCKVRKPGTFSTILEEIVQSLHNQDPYLQWFLLAAADFLVVGNPWKHNHDLWLAVLRWKENLETPFCLCDIYWVRGKCGEEPVFNCLCARDFFPCSGLCFSCL